MLCCVVLCCNTMKLVTTSIAGRLGSATLHYILISSYLAFDDIIYLQVDAECEEDSIAAPTGSSTYKQTTKRVPNYWYWLIVVGLFFIFIFILIIISFFDSFENADWLIDICESNRIKSNPSQFNFDGRKPKCIAFLPPEVPTPNRTRRKNEQRQFEPNRNATVRTTKQCQRLRQRHPPTMPIRAEPQLRPTTRSCRSWTSLNSIIVH